MNRFRQFLARFFGTAIFVRPSKFDGQYRAPVARPVVTPQSPSTFAWAQESVLVLGLGDDLVDLAKGLADRGASVSFRSLPTVQDVYQLPLEQFSMVLMDDGSIGQPFDVIDIGGILRRADRSLVLVWASPAFTLSVTADQTTMRFCDILLALPSTPDKLALFLTPINPRVQP